jgi:hypothetical protein
MQYPCCFCLDGGVFALAKAGFALSRGLTGTCDLMTVYDAIDILVDDRHGQPCQGLSKGCVLSRGLSRPRAFGANRTPDGPFHRETAGDSNGPSACRSWPVQLVLLGRGFDGDLQA